MDACIFIVTINTLMPVYAADRVTQVDQLNVNDQVCVTQIENGWAQVHWSNGSVGHTGYLSEFKVKMPGQATEPTPREEEYVVPQPAPAPDQHSQYRGHAVPDAIFRPAVLNMQCYPQDGKPYMVAYTNGYAATFAASGFKREYPVIKEHDDQSNHVFYVTMQRPDQARAVFLAFDYSQRGEDVSTLATQLPGEPRARDKCSMNWELTK